MAKFHRKILEITSNDFKSFRDAMPKVQISQNVRFSKFLKNFQTFHGNF